MDFKFNAKLWLYHGEGAWVFVTLPKDISHDIRVVIKNMPRRGFGSLKVNVEVDGVSWDTSIFPDSKSKSYILPIKKDIRKKASISVGDTCEFKVQIKDVL